MNNIGYACLTVAVPGTTIKNCMQKSATPEHLMTLIGHNLHALEKIIDYNIKNQIVLFRISSDLIPFGSSLAYDLPWETAFGEILSRIAGKIRRSGMRVSMHPGQYTVLNSPDPGVVLRAGADLSYHAKVLDSLGLSREHKIVLHLGGVYGDKRLAKDRFLTAWQDLPQGVKDRLVLENDGVSYTIADVLETAQTAQIPVIYDNLHNACNPSPGDLPDLHWIKACAPTWKNGHGRQKIHYSQQAAGKKIGAHSETIGLTEFLDYYQPLAALDLDIMLEVKDKNISALKCLNCTSPRSMVNLEQEWARYKYHILEHSANSYQAIRQLLRDKTAYPALPMYSLIENASQLPIETGGAVNAAQHVWGYFKDTATGAEKTRYQTLITAFTAGETELITLKNHLYRLAVKYQEAYLLNSYYFYL